jgi:hypothetical protein
MIPTSQTSSKGVFEKPVLPLGKGELEGVTPFLRGDFSNIL